MSRGLWCAGVLVFALTLLVKLPASWVLRGFDWAPGWQPEQVSGSLWHGRIERLGLVGPLSWQLRPLQRQLQVDAGLQQQAWALRVEGWPWRWQARLQPAPAQATTRSDYLLDGQWQGALQFEARGSRCIDSQGELSGQQLAMLAPWSLTLGSARVSATCQQGLQLLAEIERAGEHHLQARMQPVQQRLQLSGQVQPDAAITPLLVQAGLLKAGAGQFEKRFSPR
ncbi:type II secretion system protein N [Pseudomonas sp. LJDD11]|uniref:type II secretion system protein N n=1 Tax=Pseudomonas sp. LJDD11 TaxID=2931984 RepID=UPI00211CA7DF|nr:type II secretion system protein N [Pseudomonas sp. LJDD11]MCQ9425865.1 type II secretion system protein N [Pseudomonas sp. LJDD11]